MGRLWWRRLRIPIYCIIVMMAMRLFWYSLFSESKQINEYGLKDGQGMRNHPVDSDEMERGDSIRNINLDMNERFKLGHDYKADEIEASDNAVPSKYRNIKQKFVTKSTKQLKTSTEEPDNVLHDIQVMPPHFNALDKSIQTNDELEDVEMLEDNSEELDPSAVLQLDQNDVFHHPDQQIDSNKFDKPEQPVVSKESTSAEKNENTANEKVLKYSENFGMKPSDKEDLSQDRVQFTDDREFRKEPVKSLKPNQFEKHVNEEESEHHVPDNNQSEIQLDHEKSVKTENQTVKISHSIQSEASLTTKKLKEPHRDQKFSKAKGQLSFQQIDKHDTSVQPLKSLRPVQTDKSSNVQWQKPIDSQQYIQTERTVELEQPITHKNDSKSKKLSTVTRMNDNTFDKFSPIQKLEATEKHANVQNLNKVMQHFVTKEGIKAEQLKNFSQTSNLFNKSSLLTQPIMYEPNWESLDSRPLPAWYDHSKFGIFIHWGIFSVPSFSSEKFWWKWQGSEKDPAVVQFMEKNYPRNFIYPDFAKNFTVKLFNATEWAHLFQESGAQYVVLTSKHHEGFTLWPSNISKNWNSQDVGPHKDLVRLLAKAVRSTTSLKFGLYYSLFEWFHQSYAEDRLRGFQSTKFVDEKVLPELQSLINNYAPDIVWADGDVGPARYWKSKEFLTWLYNESKVKNTVVTNDRWGDETHCKHGVYTLCPDNFQPNGSEKWEKSTSIDRLSWGFRREAELKDLMTISEILNLLVTTVSKGGNFLLNIGATKEGVIPPIFQQRLTEVGKWLKVNGEGIYSSVPWRCHNDSLASGVWYTYKEEAIYAFVTKPPENSTILLGSPIGSIESKVYVLGWNDVGIPWNNRSRDRKAGIRVRIPEECWLNGTSKLIVTLKLVNFK